MTGWAAFWFCAAIFVLCEFALTLKGVNTALWQFKTPEEKVLQQRLIEQTPTDKATP